MNFYFNILSASAKSTVSSSPPPPVTEGQYIFTDKSWSWWTNPLHQYDPSNNTTYSSVVNGAGDRQIISTNHTTGETKSLVVLTVPGSVKDEHNTVGMLIRSDHILWATANRNDNPYWVGKISKDLEIIDPATDVSGQTGTVVPCYAAMFDCGGKTFSFHRSDTNHWDFIYSEDEGDTWESKIRLISKDVNNPFGNFYILGQQITGDIIKFTAYTNAWMAEEGQNKIVAFTLNCSTGEVVSDGTSYGSVFDVGWTPLSYNSLTAVVGTSGNEKIRLSDICGDDEITHMAVIDFIEEDYSQGNYRYVKFNHNTLEIIEEIEIVAHGKDNGYQSYFGGIFFEKTTLGEWSGNLYLSREESGVWYVERYSYDNGIFSMAELLDSDPVVIMRPQPPINGGPIKVYYTKGKYIDGSFEDWETKMIGVGERPEIDYSPVLFRETFNLEQDENEPTSYRNWNSFINSSAQDKSDTIDTLFLAPQSLSGFDTQPVNTGYDDVGNYGYLVAVGTRDRFLSYKDIELSNISEVSWKQGNASTNPVIYFAVRIGSNWFINETGFSTISVVSGSSEFAAGYETKQITFSGTQWVLLSFAEGSNLSQNGSPQNLDLSTVEAVGFYMEDTVGDTRTIRLDDLEIK